MGLENKGKEITFNQLKNTLLFGGALLLLFIAIIFYEVVSDKRQLISYDMEVDLMVKKVKKVKGVLLFGDSLSIYGATPLVSPIEKMKAFANYKGNLPKGFTLDQVVPNYRIAKKINSDTITVYHYGDTLLFKLILE